MAQRGLRWLRSSIGQKQAMAISGLFLIGFLVSHVGGNLLLLADADGRRYDAYAQGMRELGPLLVLARVALAALFLLHILLAIRVRVANRKARSQANGAGVPRGARAPGASSMLLTGGILLAFLLVHLGQFSFGERFASEGARYVKSTLGIPWVAALYALSFLVLWLHLGHALGSGLQTLGLVGRRGMAWGFRAGRWLAAGIALAFSLILVVVLWQA